MVGVFGWRVGGWLGNWMDGWVGVVGRLIDVIEVIGVVGWLSD